MSRNRKSYQPCVECLEKRVVLSAKLSGGVLRIDGTGGHDRVRVLQNGSGSSATIRVIESVVDEKGRTIGKPNASKPFKAAQVQRIIYHGNAGNDSFVYSWNSTNKNLSAVVLAYGGKGNDTISGGPKDDVLDGGEDSDKLTGHDGNDRIYGHDGDDWLWGVNGNDSLYGGFGADYLDGGDNDDHLHGEDDALSPHYAATMRNWTLTDTSGFPKEIRDTIYGGKGKDTIFMYYYETSAKTKIYEDHWADRYRGGDTPVERNINKPK